VPLFPTSRSMSYVRTQTSCLPNTTQTKLLPHHTTQLYSCPAAPAVPAHLAAPVQAVPHHRRQHRGGGSQRHAGWQGLQHLLRVQMVACRESRRDKCSVQVGGELNGPSWAGAGTPAQLPTCR